MWRGPRYRTRLVPTSWPPGSADTRRSTTAARLLSISGLVPGWEEVLDLGWAVGWACWGLVDGGVFAGESAGVLGEVLGQGGVAGDLDEAVRCGAVAVEVQVLRPGPQPHPPH